MYIMTAASDFISKIPNDVKIKLVQEFKQFTYEGKIGDSLLRSTTMEFAKENGMDELYAVKAMEYLALACYEYFTEQYLAGISRNTEVEI